MLTKVSLYVGLAAATVLLQIGLGADPGSLLFTDAWPGYPVYEDVLIGLGIGLLLVGLSRIASKMSVWTRRMEDEFRHILGPLKATDILVLALMSSISEELFFRGFLQPQLSLTAAAFIFGLAHFPYRSFLIPWTVAAIAVGFLFGWVFEARECLFAPIIAHFVVNYCNLHYIVRPRPSDPKEQHSARTSMRIVPRPSKVRRVYLPSHRIRPAA